MKDIEFRAWLKNKKKMVKVEEIFFIGQKQIAYDETEYRYTDKEPFHYTRWVNFEAIELMQYTRRKDKNGVKIFEGDIVKFIDDDLCYVVFDEYWSAYRFKSKEVDDNFAGFTPKNLEVVGNIYENPELLEKL